jgi:hypothetical protein
MFNQGSKMFGGGARATGFPDQVDDQIAFADGVSKPFQKGKATLPKVFLHLNFAKAASYCGQMIGEE